MKMKRFRKILICVISAVMLSFAVFASACAETSHPEVTITYEFNGETYEIKYRLYRNMYPHSVTHFLELADNHFYDDTIVHDYSTNDWIAGGYDYDADAYEELSANASTMSEYFDRYSKEDAYVRLFNENKLTATVYENCNYDKKGKMIPDKDSALPTVIGEFYNNIHQEIENGALTAEYGTLKFYYYNKKTTRKVYVAPTDKQTILADYKTNGATSLFSVQTGTSSAYTELNYTVFGTCINLDDFDEFVDAVRSYVDDEYGTSSDFCNRTDAVVDNNDDFTDKPETDKGMEVTFNVPKKPIRIISVKVNKY